MDYERLIAAVVNGRPILDYMVGETVGIAAGGRVVRGKLIKTGSDLVLMQRETLTGDPNLQFTVIPRAAIGGIDVTIRDKPPGLVTPAQTVSASVGMNLDLGKPPGASPTIGNH